MLAGDPTQAHMHLHKVDQDIPRTSVSLQTGWETALGPEPDTATPTRPTHVRHQCAGRGGPVSRSGPVAVSRSGRMDALHWSG